jgi:predicted alpha/beta-hydrolase family hydrolase
MTEPADIKVRLEDGEAVTALVYSGTGEADVALLLAHGAGAGQQSSFMTGFARALASLGVETITFNFSYVERGRRVPDRQAVLEACYRAAVDTVRREVRSARSSLFIGGKSMGGRIATHVAASDRELAFSGLVLLGYPLHPPGRPAERRDAHLSSVNCPLLFVQGSRDSFGTPAELEPLVSAARTGSLLHVVGGGDHSFKISKATDSSQKEALRETQIAIARWIQAVRPSP